MILNRIKIKIRAIINRVRYFGNVRYCPICEKSSSCFLQFGSPKRLDAQCPFCGSLERDRLSWLYLQRGTDFFNVNYKRVLHIAPEAIFEQKFRKQHNENYITADLFRSDVMVKMDITKINYSDDYFDIIYCSHVLEHVPNDIKAIQEFYRVLTHEGWAILLVPISGDVTQEDLSITDPKLRLKLYGLEDHVRQYGADYIDRLKLAGFKVKCLKPLDFLNKNEIKKMGITQAASVIYFCTK